MKATVFHGTNDIRVEEVKRPQAGVGEAVIRVTLTSVPWRDLPAVFGPWSSVCTRWRRWAHLGIWAAILHVLDRSATGVLRLHATILHLLGIDHTKLTVRQNGIGRRLTDVHGHVIDPILA